MKINYLVSIVLLLISFLLLKKKKEKKDIIHSLIYTICLFYCYQTVVVCLISFLKLGGNLLIYSIINYLISIVLYSISIKNKQIQKYKLNIKELILVLIVIITLFLITYYRFRGFNSISYISNDPSIHYRASTTFADKLSILNKSNLNDLIYDETFDGMMPMFYINCGFFIKIFSFIKSYKAFMIHESFCLILYALLFLITIRKQKNTNYLYTYIATILYSLAYPLNNLIYGFSYLGLGIMTINLLFYTISEINDKLKINKTLNITVLFILTFSLFNSYFLFMPFIYLSLGIYYIKLWKKKKLTTKETLLYGIITLIIPFIQGFTFFMLPGFFNPKTNIIGFIALNGDIYISIVPLYLFMIITAYLIYDKFKKKPKTTYFLLNFYIFSSYIFIFFILYALKISASYYFYKLFYLYWLFISLYIVKALAKKKIILYTFFIILFLTIRVVIKNPYSNVSRYLEPFSIYIYNAKKFDDVWIRLDKDELDLLDNTIKYKEQCEIEKILPFIGRNTKNAWVYAITGSVPNINYKVKSNKELYKPNISLDEWKISKYKCALYLKENIKEENIKEYQVLYQNKKGVLLSKK